MHVLVFDSHYCRTCFRAALAICVGKFGARVRDERVHKFSLTLIICSVVSLLLISALCIYVQYFFFEQYIYIYSDEIILVRMRRGVC